MNRINIIHTHINNTSINDTSINDTSINDYTVNKIGLIGVSYSVAQPIIGCERASNCMIDRGLISMLRRKNCVRYEEDIQIVEEDKDCISFSSDGRIIKNAWSIGQTSFNIFQRSLEIRMKGYIPLIIGGDHSIALGSVASALVNDPNVGILWIDAHGDINTPTTSLTMNLHGMPLSFLMRLVNPSSIKGFKWMYNIPILKPDRLVYIGIRDLDVAEKEIIKKLGITNYTMEDIKLYGIDRIMDMALKQLQTKSSTSIHVSWDIDALDPIVAPITGTPVCGGLSKKESLLIAKRIASTKSLTSIDMVEINPLLGSNIDDSNETIDIANQIICNMFN